MGGCHSSSNGEAEGSPKGSKLRVSIADQLYASPAHKALAQRGAPRAAQSPTHTATSSNSQPNTPGHGEVREDEVEEVIRFVHSVSLFKDFPEDEAELCARAFRRRRFKEGAEIIKQGEIGDAFFILKKGTVKVLINDEKSGVPNHVADLKVGDHFGEAALLNNEPRNATIVASEKVLVYKITRERFRELGLHQKLVFPKRHAVGGMDFREMGGVVATKPPSPKTPEQISFLKKSIKDNKNLSALMTLSDHLVHRMVDSMWREEVLKHEAVVVEGDEVADYFYIVESGSFKVTQQAKRSSTSTEIPEEIVGDAGDITMALSSSWRQEATTRAPSDSSLQTQLANLGRGKSFGEVALLYNAPRNATVAATKDSVVFVLDRLNFHTILQEGHEEKRRANVKYLDMLDSTSFLLPDEKEAIAQTFVHMIFYKDDVIFEKGETRDHMMIFYTGEVSVATQGRPLEHWSTSTAPRVFKKETTCWTCSTLFGREKRETSESKQSKENPLIFGEQALEGTEEIYETITVTSNEAHGLMLQRDAFEFLLRQPLLELREARRKDPKHIMSCLQTIEDHNVEETRKHSKSKSAVPTTENFPFEDLKVVGILGSGGFGYVELCSHERTGKSFALKTVSKGYVVKTGMKSSILMEKQILMLLDSAFIVKLYQTYNHDQTVCFLLEVALGGELHQVYQQNGFYGSAKHAKYYLAGVVLGFDHCHSRHVIYRDLKPENLLLDESGRLKITDMGLAKQVIGMTYTTCGTPDYFAPEVIGQTGQTIAVDWWCIGILLFEFLTGNAPFAASSPVNIYKKVMAGISNVQFPKAFANMPEAQDMVKRLLQKEPSHRLPMIHGGSINLKKHKFYSNFDWKAMASARAEPPFQPKVGSKLSTHNFADEASRPPMVPYKPDGTEWDKRFACVVSH